MRQYDTSDTPSVQLKETCIYRQMKEHNCRMQKVKKFEIKLALSFIYFIWFSYAELELLNGYERRDGRTDIGQA